MSNNSLSTKDLELFKKLKRRNGIILTIFSLIYIAIATAVAMFIGTTKTVEVSEPHEFYSNYEKFDDIVSLLDLFQGELSLNDVLNQDMIILTKLRESKIRINEKVAKEREKQARAVQSKK